MGKGAVEVMCNFGFKLGQRVPANKQKRIKRNLICLMEMLFCAFDEIPYAAQR